MTARIIGAGLLALSLAACTTTDPYGGGPKLSNMAGGAGVGAGVGAVTGAVFAAAAGKDARIAALMGAGIGALAGGAIGSYMDKQESELRAQLQGTGVSITRVGNQIILNMPSAITFDVDRADVKPQFRDTLTSVALVLRKYDKTIVDVYGHTDATGSDQYNLALSERRAVAVATLVSQQGIDPRRFYVEGRGENDPVASNSTESGRAQNRRVEIQISPLGKG